MCFKCVSKLRVEVIGVNIAKQKNMHTPFDTISAVSVFICIVGKEVTSIAQTLRCMAENSCARLRITTQGPRRGGHLTTRSKKCHS